MTAIVLVPPGELMSLSSSLRTPFWTLPLDDPCDVWDWTPDPGLALPPAVPDEVDEEPEE